MNYKIYYEGDELNRGVFCFSKYVVKKYILVFHGLLGRGKNWHSIIKRLSSLVALGITQLQKFWRINDLCF